MGRRERYSRSRTQASKVTGGTGTGTSIYKDPQHLDGPLGLTFATNGDLVTANFDPVAVDGEPSELTEFTPAGTFVSQLSIDATAGGAFALYGPRWVRISLVVCADNSPCSSLMKAAT
jgi:hypothetical protein